MLGIFIAKDLTTSNRHIVLLSSDQRAGFRARFRQGGQVVYRSEDIKLRTISFPEETDLTFERRKEGE